jgi:hypothetical protein
VDRPKSEKREVSAETAAPSEPPPIANSEAASPSNQPADIEPLNSPGGSNSAVETNLADGVNGG